MFSNRHIKGSFSSNFVSENCPQKGFYLNYTLNKHKTKNNSDKIPYIYIAWSRSHNNPSRSDKAYQQNVAF